MALFNDLVKKYQGLLSSAGNTLSQLQPVKNLQAWGQVAQSPQLRQQYTQQVIQPKVQQFIQPKVQQVQRIAQPILSQPITNFTAFKGIPSPTVGQVGQKLLSTAQQSFTKTNQLEKNFQTPISQWTPEQESLAQETMYGLQIGGIAKPVFSKAQVDLARNLPKEARDLIGKFAAWVEKTGGKGIPKGDIAHAADYVHSVGETIIGRDATNLTNLKLKNAFDVLLKQVDQAGGPFRFPTLGASTQNLRRGQPQATKGVGGVSIDNVSKLDLALYGKETGAVGRNMFGGESGIGVKLAENAQRELDQVGVLAQASKNIEVRRDARKVIHLLSDRVDDTSRIERLQQMKNNLESEGTPEANVIKNAIDKMVKPTQPQGVGGVGGGYGGEKYKSAGDYVSGLRVRDSIPNQESIKATFDNPQTLSGVREIPMSEFGKTHPSEISARSKELAGQIKASGEINPLIVAVTKDGRPYILEGANRFDALQLLGKKSIPAQVVLEEAPLYRVAQPITFPPSTTIKPQPSGVGGVGGGVAEEARTLMQTAKQKLPNFDEAKIMDYASKIAKADKSPTILPQHLAEALQYREPNTNINKVRIENLLKGTKGRTLGFSGNEQYTRMQELGITDYLDPNLPKTFAEVSSKVSNLNPNSKDLLKLAIDKFLYLGKKAPGEGLTIQELKQVGNIIDTANRISKLNKNIAIQPQDIAEALQYRNLPEYIKGLKPDSPSFGRLKEVFGKDFSSGGVGGVGGVKSKSVIEDIKGGFSGGRKARETSEDIRQGPLGQRLKTDLLDRLTPVFDFINKAGKNLPTENNPYRKMRLLAGVSGKVESFLSKNIAPILTAERGRLDDLSALWTLERESELVGRGLTRKRNAEQIAQGIEELKAKYGEEGFRTLQQSSAKLRAVGNGLLDDLHRAGIIGDDSFNAIRKNNQFYAPFEAVEHIADNLEKGAYGRINSFNVASQNVIKKIGDYAGDVADPIETLVRRIPKIIALVEKNKAMQSLANMRKQYPDVYKDLIVPLKADVTAPGMKTINLFENGKNVTYAVPDVVANAIKGLDAETSNILVSLGSIQAKMLRAGATGLNIGFIPVNIVRDVQDALTTELTERGAKAMFQFLASYPAAIFSAARKGNLYQEWASSGGLQSTMTEQIFKRTPQTVAQLSGKGPGIIKGIINGPRLLVEFANRVGEQSTRLARFKSGVARGESLEEAAFKSRDISLDFAKAGNSIKVLNQVIPFLNAGIQGSEKVLRLYKDNPKAAVAVTGALFGVPAVALYTHNSQFKDFNDIPNSEKQSNWILIARDRTDEEIAQGEKVIGIKIPKGFLARITTNTIESSLDFLKQKDPNAFISSTLDVAEGLSPVGLPLGKERLGHTVSTILPPWLQAGAEALSNTNFYFGSPIVSQSLQRLPASEQFRENTPSVYKNIGALTNTSPLVLENTVNTTTGGLGRQMATLFSGDLAGATTGQISRRFSGIRGGKQSDIAYETVAKEKEYTALRNKRLREAFEAGNETEFEKLIEGMKTSQVKQVLNSVQDKAESKKLTPEQRAYETLTNEEKLRLGQERPDLTSKLQLGDQTFAASPLMTSIKEKNKEEMVKSMVSMTGKAQMYNGKYFYPDEEGDTKTLNLNPVEKPKLTGNTELDKVKISSYNSKLSTQIKNIAKAQELGVFTPDEAEKKIKELSEMKITKPKKPKKITLKTIRFPKVKLAKVKVKKIKIPKPKRVKKYSLKTKKVKSSKVKLSQKLTNK